MRPTLITAVASVNGRTNLVPMPFTWISGMVASLFSWIMAVTPAGNAGSRTAPCGGDAGAGEELGVLLVDDDAGRRDAGGDHALHDLEDELLVRGHGGADLAGDAVGLDGDLVVLVDELARTPRPGPRDP